MTELEGASRNKAASPAEMWSVWASLITTLLSRVLKRVFFFSTKQKLTPC